MANMSLSGISRFFAGLFLTLPKGNEEKGNFFTVPEGNSIANRIKSEHYKYGLKETVGNFLHNPLTVGTWEYDFYSNSEDIPPAVAMLHVKEDNWQAPLAEHLIAYANTLQETPIRPIVALGAVCTINGIRHVLAVSSTNDGYGFALHQYEGDWDSGFDFLRVRRVQQ